MRIKESGMLFGDYDDENCFWIEESYLYDVSLRHLGFKSVEFVLHRCDEGSSNSRLLFVEARTSFISESDAWSFHNEISDVSQKFMDSLQIICGAWHGGRKNKIKLPPGFSEYYDKGNKIVFLLVIKNGKKINLLPIREAIQRQLLKEHRLWRFDVKVLDEELAKKEKLTTT